MTIDYLNEFTPDWPHGHVLVYADGTAKPFVVVIEETEAGEEKLPDDFSLASAEAALKTPKLVSWAFDWSTAPQGYDFWLDYFNETLSPEGVALAREALRRWIAIAEQGVTP